MELRAARQVTETKHAFFDLCLMTCDLKIEAVLGRPCLVGLYDLFCSQRCVLFCTSEKRLKLILTFISIEARCKGEDEGTE